MYDELISIVYDYIYKIGVEDFENFSMIYNCSEIILNEKDFNFNYKNKKKYDFKKIDLLVEDFLYNLNSSYLEYYRLRKSDGSFIFDVNDKSGGAYSTYNDDTNHREIYVGLTGYIEDGFSIVHELFHDINMTDNVFDSNGRYFFTESLSMLGEFLFYDYLSLKNIVDKKNVMQMCFYFLRSKALEVNFNLKLIQEYFEHGYLNDVIVNDIIKSYPEQYIGYIDDIIFSICQGGWLTLEEEQTYILSSLSAIYMYYRIKDNKKNLCELFDLNQILNDLNLGQVLDYLGLEHDDFDLTSDSYSLLRDGYKKFIKRW